MSILTTSADQSVLIVAAFLGLKILVAKHLCGTITGQWNTQARSQALWFAMCSNDKDTARLLLEHGGDPNVVVYNGESWKNDLLIEMGPHAYESFKLNRRALHIAILNQNTDSIRLLLLHGADANMTTEDIHKFELPRDPV